MKYYLKSAGKISAAALFLGLCSCGGNVPPDVLAAPRAVQVPQGPADTSWQRLGDVPNRPKDFTPQKMIDASRREMKRDRDEAQDRQQDYENQ